MLWPYRAQDKAIEEPDPVPSWSARYTAYLTGSKKLVWEETFHGFAQTNREAVALNLVAHQTEKGLVRDGVLYPLHRILRITADIL